MSLISRNTAAPAAPAAPDPAVVELTARVRSLHDHCLTNLAGGLDAMAKGDLTIEVCPVTTAIDKKSDDPHVTELIELFNNMLGKAQAALQSYNDMREQL